MIDVENARLTHANTPCDFSTRDYEIKYNYANRSLEFIVNNPGMYFVFDNNANDKLFVHQIICHCFLEHFGMIEERLRTLVRHLGPARLAQATAITNRRRWQTVATEMKVKTRIEDLEELLKAFPQYELWLWKGEVDPAKGQISPGYDETNSSLSSQSAG